MKEKKLPKIAISVGDINGVGIEILVRSHESIAKICEPFYFIHKNLLKNALKLLNLKLKHANLVLFENAQSPNFKLLKKGKNFTLFSYACPLSLKVQHEFKIKPSSIDAKSGAYAFLSFEAASSFCFEKHANALVTLPIHKKAWSLAGVKFRGHTEALREFYYKDAIMMLGCKELFVGLFTEHIPLSEVSSRICFEAFAEFLYTFYKETHFKKIGVLGFNPHAGDHGVIGGKEEAIMQEALTFINAYLSFSKAKKSKQNAFLKEFNVNHSLFDECLQTRDLRQSLIKTFTKNPVYLSEILVADTAFSKANLKHCKRFVAAYHDLALAPLKALYFEKSVNVSLNLPIIRTSVDHGTAFDKAYKGAKINIKSYQEAVRFALKLIAKR